jgi:hypothetical protein
MVRQVGRLVEHELLAVTQISPPDAPAVTITVVVPCPLLMVQPAGTVQLYEVAPATEVIEYVNPPCPLQTEVSPVIAAGEGTEEEIETPRQEGVLVAHVFIAVTQILPLEALEVTEIEVVPCPELMVHPNGTVQL